MTSKDKYKVQAFIDYANDSEGMVYTLTQTATGSWKAKPAKPYSPVVMSALVRNFRSDFGA